MYLGRFKIDDVIVFPANTHTAATGAATDADAVPSYRVYEDETGTAILTGNTAKLDDANTTGFYSEQITLSAANGFEVGKSYTIYVSATVASVTGTMSHTFRVELEPASAAALATVDTNVDTLVASITTIEAMQAGLVLARGTIGDTGNSTTALHLEGLTYGNDEINSYLLVIFDVSTSEYHSRWIEDWADTGDLATVATLPFTPQNDTDTYWLLPIRSDVTGNSGLDAAGVRAAVGLAAANLDTQLLSIDDAIDTEVGTILTRIGTPSDLGGGASLAANLVVVEGQTDDIGVAGAGLTALGDTRVANLDGTISSRASQTSVDTIDNLLDTEIGTLLTNVAAILADTGTDGVVVAAGSKAGYALSATGLDSIPMTAPAGPATTFREALVQTWRRWFKRSVLNTDDGEITTYADNGTTVITTQVVSDDGTEQVVEAAA